MDSSQELRQKVVISSTHYCHPVRAAALWSGLPQQTAFLELIAVGQLFSTPDHAGAEAVFLAQYGEHYSEFIQTLVISFFLMMLGAINTS